MEHRSARVADSGDDLAQVIGKSTSPSSREAIWVRPVGPVAIRGNRVVGLHLLTLERSAGWVLYDAAVQLGGEPVDLPGQLRVGLEFKLLLGEVVVGLRLLERRLPVLAEHHKR